MESRKGGGKEGGTERQSKGERDEGTGGGRERGGGVAAAIRLALV